MQSSFHGIEPGYLGGLIAGLLFASALWAVVIAETLLF